MEEEGKSDAEPNESPEEPQLEIEIMQDSEENNEFQAIPLEEESKHPRPSSPPTDPEIKEGGIHTNTKDSIKQYFKYYSKLANQQNMMSDYIRTGHYYDAIIKNKYKTKHQNSKIPKHKSQKSNTKHQNTNIQKYIIKYTLMRTHNNSY
jgi:hypothetical protein